MDQLRNLYKGLKRIIPIVNWIASALPKGLILQLFLFVFLSPSRFDFRDDANDEEKEQDRRMFLACGNVPNQADLELNVTRAAS